MTAPFNGNMLFLARQLRRMAQEELVERLGGLASQGTLSKIERGRLHPPDELVERLSQVLQMRPSFFSNSTYLRQPPVSFHRARKALAARDETAIHARAEFYRLSIKKLFSDIELQPVIAPPPAIDIDQYNGDAREIARVVRKRWNVKRGPLNEITNLLEDAGVIIVPFEFGTPLIDGFCQHGGDGLPPLIFINASLPIDRLRFSLAHELGHLVMHDVPNPEQEIQANHFASELLMPSADIEDHFFDLRLTKFMELKLYWGVSMQALISKAWQLGRISDRQYKSLFMDLSKRGWRKAEPVQVAHLRERPSTLKAAIKAHADQLGSNEEELSDLLGIAAVEFRSWFPVEHKRPVLRLVTGQR